MVKDTEWNPYASTGEAEVSLQPIHNPALEGGGGQHHHVPASLTLGKKAPILQKAEWASWLVRTTRNISHSPGLDPRTV